MEKKIYIYIYIYIYLLHIFRTPFHENASGGLLLFADTEKPTIFN